MAPANGSHVNPSSDNITLASYLHATRRLVIDICQLTPGVQIELNLIDNGRSPRELLQQRIDYFIDSIADDFEIVVIRLEDFVSLLKDKLNHIDYVVSSITPEQAAHLLNEVVGRCNAMRAALNECTPAIASYTDIDELVDIAGEYTLTVDAFSQSLLDLDENVAELFLGEDIGALHELADYFDLSTEPINKGIPIPEV